MDRNAPLAPPRRRLEFILGAALVCLYLWHFHPYLSNRTISGWDTPGHLQLLQVFAEKFLQAKPQGYDTSAFAGYPVFRFYGPFSYFYLGLPFFLSGGIVPLTVSFNVMFFLLPLLLLAAFHAAVKSRFGAEGGWAAFAGAFYFFTAPYSISLHGIGLQSLSTYGLIANALGLTLMCALLAASEAVQAGGSRRARFALLCCAVAIIVNHAITATFTALVVAVEMLTAGKRNAFRMAPVYFAALALSAFFWLPLLCDLNLTSTQNFPGAGPETLNVLLHLLHADIRTNTLSAAGDLFMKPGLLPTLLICGAAVAGAWHLVSRRKYFLPAAFAASLLLQVPALEPLQYLTLHYSRFLAGTHILFCMLAAGGLARIAAVIMRRPGVRPGLIAPILAVSTIASLGISSYRNLERWEGQVKPLLLDEYPLHGEAKAFMRDIARKHGGGRVAVEESFREERTLGTPNFFKTVLPSDYGIDVLHGLTVESALSGPYLLYSLERLFENRSWGLIPFSDYSLVSGAARRAHYRRLERYGVHYLLLSGRLAQFRAAHDTDSVKMIASSEHYAFYELLRRRPLIQAPLVKPFLYVNEGGIPFRRFTEQWFQSDELIEHPVIFTEKHYTDLAPDEQDAVGGFIVSAHVDSAGLSRLENGYRKFGKPVVAILPRRMINYVNLAPDSAYVFEKEGRINAARLAGVLARLQPAVQGPAEDIPARLVDEEITFTHKGGVEISYSYATGWRSSGSARTVFWSAPSLMFVVGNGATTLRYDWRKLK